MVGDAHGVLPHLEFGGGTQTQQLAQHQRVMERGALVVEHDVFQPGTGDLFAVEQVLGADEADHGVDQQRLEVVRHRVGVRLQALLVVAVVRSHGTALAGLKIHHMLGRWSGWRAWPWRVPIHFDGDAAAAVIENACQICFSILPVAPESTTSVASCLPEYRHPFNRHDLTTGGALMDELELSKAFTLMESGPVVLVTTHDGTKDNIMTISWTMVMDFTPVFAITTGEWNHSFAALRKNRECVIAIPTVDLLDKVVGIGTCSGADIDKFAKFKLTPVQAKLVRPPLIKECLANMECKVIDIVKKHNIVVLEAVAAYLDTTRKEKRTVHAMGDGTFIVDGRMIDRKKMMASKLLSGV